MNNKIDIKEFNIFPWNKNLETGIESIDNEHKQLIYLLNKLANTLKNDETLEISNAFNDLALYADFHFTSEEKVWQKYLNNDELVKKHQATHASFLPKVLELKDKEKDKPLELVIEDILKFLIRWLAFHIIGEDKRLATIIHALEDGKNIEEAKKVADDNINNSMKILLETILSMYDGLSSQAIGLVKEKQLLEQINQKNIEIEYYVSELNRVAIVSKTDLKGKITFANDFFCEISEYKREELIGKSHNIVRHEDVPKAVYKDMWDLIKSGKTWEGDLKNKTKHGSVYYIHGTVFPIFENDGKTIKEYIAIRFLTTNDELKRREFKKKVLINYQEQKKENSQYKSRVTELEENTKRLNTHILSLENLVKETKAKEESRNNQIDFYENKINEMDARYEKVLKQSKENMQQLLDLYKKAQKTSEKEKEIASSLIEENKIKTRKIENLNDQLSKQRLSIDNLNKIISKK